MIQSVEINVKNGVTNELNALVIFSKNVCYINNHEYQISEEFKDELLDTIYMWKHEYGSDGNIDSKEFLITVRTDNKEEYFHGKGIFPENYGTIEELLGESDE